MRRRVLVSIAGLLAGLLAAPPLWIALHLRDLPEPGDAALTLPPPDSSQGDANEDLRAVARSVHWPDDTEERWRAVREGRTWDPDWVRSMLRENRGAYAALDRMLAGPDLQIPVGDHDAIMSHSESYLAVLQLAKLAVAEALVLQREGDQSAAFQRALLGMRTGRKISEAYGVNLLALIMATSTQGVSLYALEQRVREASLDREEARALARELAAQRWDSAAWERAWAAEYQFVAASLAEIDAWMAGAPPNPLGEEDGVAARILDWLPWDYAWQPNRTRSELAADCLELRRSAPHDCRSALAAQSREVEVPEQLRLSSLLLPNPIGRRIGELSTSHFERFDLKRCHLETRIGLVQTQIALKAYWDAWHALPEALAELVPTYLDAVPIDRFDGAPLRYSREQGIVYSIGNDGIDAGGSDPPSQTQAREPTIRLAL